ncbi:MAG: bifunctional riboflavin kinase/FAD synthetase [Pirellulaceae bacterium]
MKLIRKLDSFPPELRGGAITIGNFDGVHHGHRAIMETLKHLAKKTGGPSIVFTFDPHPVRILRPEQSPPPLTWTNRKSDLLGALGVDAMIAYPTDLNLLQLEYKEFFQKIVVELLGAKAMVEGPNFHFGRHREGNIERLSTLCIENHIQLDIVSPRESDGDWVSSSRIRKLVQAGEVTTARQMLTEPYRIRGIVVHGDARGKQLGFPTANLDGIDTLIPGPGVYAGRAKTDSTSWIWSAIHIGPLPTFGKDESRVEVHLLDFDDSLYGQTLEVEFLDKLRDVRSFADAGQLKEQIDADVRGVRDAQRANVNGPTTPES